MELIGVAISFYVFYYIELSIVLFPLWEVLFNSKTAKRVVKGFIAYLITDCKVDFGAVLDEVIRLLKIGGVIMIIIAVIFIIAGFTEGGYHE